MKSPKGEYEFDIHGKYIFVHLPAKTAQGYMEHVFAQEYIGEMAEGIKNIIQKGLQPGAMKDAVHVSGLVDPQSKKKGHEPSAHFLSRMENDLLQSLKKKVFNKFQVSYESKPITPSPDTEYLIHVRMYPDASTAGQIVLELRLEQIDKNPKKPSMVDELVSKTRKFFKLR